MNPHHSADNSELSEADADEGRKLRSYAIISGSSVASPACGVKEIVGPDSDGPYSDDESGEDE